MNRSEDIQAAKQRMREIVSADLPFERTRVTREEAIAEIKLRSRQYAKRQLTWLRRDKDIYWYHWEKTRDLADCLAFSTEILREYGVSCS